MVGYDNIGFEKGRKSRCDSYKIRKEKAKKEAEDDARDFAEMWKEASCSDKFSYYIGTCCLYTWTCACCAGDCCDKWCGWYCCKSKNEYTQPYADRCSELENGESKFSNLRY